VKALVKYASGPGNVGLRDWSEPTLRPGWMLVEIAYAGICGSDIHIRNWDIQIKLQPPVVMGHEFSGHILALGEGVTGFQVGQAVVCETGIDFCGHCAACMAGHTNLCADKQTMGYIYDGCFAKTMLIPAHRTHLIPAGVDLLSAAATEPLGCVVHATLDATRITAGDLVVVAGPGSIGLLALQTAKASGARVIVTGAKGDEGRLALAKQLGAEAAINVMEQDLDEVVREMSGGEGVDVYLECSGAPAAARAGFKVLHRLGQYTQIGLAGAPFEIDLSTVAYKGLRVNGSIGQRRADWVRSLKLMANGTVQIRPLISHELALEDWEEGFRLFESREGGKIILKP
jgi:L-iditol 2-dehydrogenase